MPGDSTPVASERKQISRRLRYEILRRDAHTCRYCGASAPDVELHVDHVVPVALGGTNDPSNLTTACVDCNTGKASASPDDRVVAAVDADAERWAEAMERAAEIQRRSQAGESSIESEFYAYWVEWFDTHTIDKQWKGSVAQFTRAGLNIDDLRYAIDATANKDNVGPWYLWRYFCGVCWKIVRDRQTLAREILDGRQHG